MAKDKKFKKGTLQYILSQNYTWDAGEIISLDTKSTSSSEEVLNLIHENQDLENMTQEATQAKKDGKNEEQDDIADYQQGEKEYQEALAFVKDAIAPSYMKVEAKHMEMNDMFCKTYFTYAYPDYLEGNWLSPLINWDVKFDMSMFLYPVDSAKIMGYLKKRLTELRSERAINQEKWLVNDPYIDAQLQDVEELRVMLARWSEKYFHFSIYVTLYEESEEKLQKLGNDLENMLHGRNILTKPALLRSEQWFTSTAPYCKDEVWVSRNISTRGLSTTFPFTSSTLSQDDGIMYGINTHNNSLVIFDRFKTENANMVALAKSGWGKSFAVKLEILRSMMLGTDVIVIDPENEYKPLVDTVGGSYLNLNINSHQRINPFDLPLPMKDYLAQPWDLLRGAIVGLIGLFRLMIGDMTATEEALIEKALITTYSLNGITLEDDDITNKEVPIMKDLYSVLETMDGAENIAQRLEKYVTWVFGGIFSERTNVDLKDGLQVFSVRDLDDELRPIAMFILLSYIWNRVRSSSKKRILVVDEAWNIMQHEDSAKFLFWLVKRARKYYLGITTITQDVEDFANNRYGRAIISNSSMQLLLKQSPASIDALQGTFKLTEQEKYILLNASVGQGLFFAGMDHVGLQILASYFEEKVVTTTPTDG